MSTSQSASSSSLHGAEGRPIVWQNSNKMTSITTTSLVPLIFDKFTLFPKLPTELRDMVWNYALINLPLRIVEVEYSTTEKKILAATLPPAPLQVCADSRKLALKQYDRLSFTNFTGAYINWELDTIMLNITNPVLFYQELTKINCTDLYQKCTRLIINASTTPGKTFFDAGNISRGDEEWYEDPTNLEAGYYVEQPLFGYFEVLKEVSVTYLGKVPKGEGNLSIEMASDDVLTCGHGSAAPRKGSARQKITELGYNFPSQELLDKSVETIDTTQIVKLVRGAEKKMTKVAKLRKAFLTRLKKVEEFHRVKGVMDEMYADSLGEDGDEAWKEKIGRWARSIPAGPEAWPEDWARALSDLWV